MTALPPDEAVRFLVHLANLRGGPDNITVLIVQVPGGSTRRSRKASFRTGALKSGGGRLEADVPWPFTASAAGVDFALVSLLMHQEQVPAAMLLFVSRP